MSDLAPDPRTSTDALGVPDTDELLRRVEALVREVCESPFPNLYDTFLGGVGLAAVALLVRAGRFRILWSEDEDDCGERHIGFFPSDDVDEPELAAMTRMLSCLTPHPPHEPEGRSRSRLPISAAVKSWVDHGIPRRCLGRLRYVGQALGVRCLAIVPQVGAGGERMRAVVHDRYGPPEVMRLADVERPAPKDDEVLVRVCASTVTRSDTALRSAEYWFTRAFTGLRGPKQRIAGMELAGTVEAAGTAVSRFQVGDEVFGIRPGANAEYVCVRERGVLAHKPADITFEQAAAVPDGACTALAFLRQAGLEQGQRLLVYGASGSIGTAAVQLGRHFGAKVTAVCDARHQKLVQSLGAGTVIDYRREDFTANGLTYDVILDAVGKLSAWRSRRSLEPSGTYVSAGSAGSLLGVLALSLLTRLVGSRRIKLGMVEYRGEDLRFLEELIDRGGYRAVIDRSYPLEDVVEAHRYVDTHQKTGNVVLTVRNDCGT